MAAVRLRLPRRFLRFVRSCCWSSLYSFGTLKGNWTWRRSGLAGENEVERSNGFELSGAALRSFNQKHGSGARPRAFRRP